MRLSGKRLIRLVAFFALLGWIWPIHSTAQEPANSGGETQEQAAPAGDAEPAQKAEQPPVEDPLVKPLTDLIATLKGKQAGGSLSKADGEILAAAEARLAKLQDKEISAVADAATKAGQLIGGYKGDPEDILEFVVPLESVLDRFLADIPVDDPKGGHGNDEIGKAKAALAALKASLDSLNGAGKAGFDSTLSSEVRTLLAEITSYTRRGEYAAMLGEIDKAMAAATSKEDDFLPPLLDPDVQTALKKIRATVDGAIAEDPAVSFESYANKIVALIPDAANLKSDIKVSQIRKSSAAMSARSALLAKLNLLADVPQARMHVFEAVFGDLRSGADRSRRCSATKAVRAKCQAKDECSFAATDKGTELCGFNPVPKAPDEHVKVRVTYVCSNGSKDEWDKAVQNPDAVSLPRHLEHERRTIVFVAGQPATLRCGIPAKEFFGENQ